jgi:hypothetical protein
VFDERGIASRMNGLNQSLFGIIKNNESERCPSCWHK